MEDKKVFVVEVLEDVDINEAPYVKGTRFSFDHKIPDHIQEAIDAGKAKVVEGGEADAELPKEEASAPSSPDGSEASAPAPETPNEPQVPGGEPAVTPEAPAQESTPGAEDTTGANAPAA